MTRRRRQKKRSRQPREDGASAASVAVDGGPPPVVSWKWLRVPLCCLLTLTAIYSSTHMNPGVDTWMSLAGGRHILQHGVDDRDPFSWNSRPSWVDSGEGSALHPTGWINQNWLTHVVLAGITETTGLDGLVVWKVFIYLGVAVLLVAAARSRGAPLALAIMATAVGLIAARDFFEIRAQEMTNIFTCALLLVLTIGTRSRPWALWLVIPLVALWSNFHGGFVFGLIVLAIFVAVEAVAGRVLPGCSTVSPSAVRTVVLAGIIAVAASVVFSPYHLTNLSHTLVVTVSADASLWQEVAEWQPLLADGPGGVRWFIVLALATIVASFASFARLIGQRETRTRISEDPGVSDHSDLWSIAVALVACLMAFQSRRFIPIAALVSVPVLAERLWISAPNTVRRFAAAAPAANARIVIAAAWLALVIAGVAIERHLGETFFGPWPASYHATSVFDRLTHSQGRPEGLCSFLNRNQVEGNLFTPWEEAGYLAACQPSRGGEGGALSVRVFIDARAQAAYEVGVLSAYLRLRPGERSADDDPSPVEIDRLLQRQRVDLVHEIRGGRSGPLYRAVEASSDWVLVYADDRHELFADRRSSRGRIVVNGLRSGALDYPDDLSRATTLAASLLESDPGQAFDVAEEALGPEPNPRLMELVVDAGKSSKRTAELESVCREQIDDLLENWESYRGRHGFGHRLLVSGRAVQLLREIAVAEGDDTEQRRLDRLNSKLRTEMESINRMIMR